MLVYQRVTKCSPNCFVRPVSPRVCAEKKKPQKRGGCNCDIGELLFHFFGCTLPEIGYLVNDTLLKTYNTWNLTITHFSFSNFGGVSESFTWFFVGQENPIWETVCSHWLNPLLWLHAFTCQQFLQWSFSGVDPLSKDFSFGIWGLPNLQSRISWGFV